MITEFESIITVKQLKEMLSEHKDSDIVEICQTEGTDFPPYVSIRPKSKQINRNANKDTASEQKRRMIAERFKALIKAWKGSLGEIDTWDMVEELPYLDGSTIDKVSLENGEIRFYYNVNEGDYDTIGKFSVDGLFEYLVELEHLYDAERGLVD